MIYIVEDDSSIRELEQYALQSNGYETTGCEDAASFWAALRSGRPDLVILDVMLPDEDGYQILAKLRADPACAATPVIMVTAKTSEIDVVKGLDHGADDYLCKPFGIMEFISRVRAVLRRAAAAALAPIIDAYTRSLQVGVPPRCMWPKMVARVSIPVAASIRFAMEPECPMPSALMMMLCFLPLLRFSIIRLIRACSSPS